MKSECKLLLLETEIILFLTFAILFFGAILLPDLWWTFYSDFKKRKKSVGISEWIIEKYANRNLTELRTELLKPEFEQKTIFDIKRVTKF